MERTSTIVVSCHGCCYQSKHYVLKNMWVTLEVPQPDGDSPRHVHGRVTWVQRPLGVRELFQVGVELEIPGNLWGVAFSPPDWIPFPDNPAPETSRQKPETSPLEPAESASHKHTAEHAKTDAASRDHLRMVPSDGAAELSAAEARPLIAALYAQFQEAERRATPGTDNAPDTPELHSLAHAETASPDSLKIGDEVGEELESRLQAVREQWNREITESARQASERVAAELGQLEQERRGQFEQRVESKLRQTIDNLEWAAGEARSKVAHAQENLAGLRKQAEEAAAPLRAIEESLRAQAEISRVQLAAIQTAARHFTEGARENLELISRQAGEIGATASASLSEEARKHIEVVLVELRSRAGGALSEVAASMENHAAAIRATLESEARRFSSEFRGSLTQQTDQAVAHAQKELAAEGQSLREDLRIQCELQARELRQAITSLGNQAVDEFRKRLTDASDSWLSAAIAKLNEESKERIESLAKTAESRLRETCGAVFASVGETLHHRLVEAVVPPANPQPETGSENPPHAAAESESQ